MAKIIPYLLLLLTISLETAKNVFSNDFSKKVLKNTTDIYKFNTFMYIGSFAVLCFFRGGGISLFTVITAFLFALAVWFNQCAYLKALTVGPMSFTTFIQGVALIFPIIVGAIFWEEKIMLRQIALLAVLIIAMFLALDIRKGSFSIKWWIYSLLTMVTLGAIGILQSVHQMSEHSGELVNFLRIAFLFAVLMNFFGWRICEKKQKSGYSIKSKAALQAGASGIAMGLVHVINLYLAGVLPKVIFFPVSNGGLIFVTLIAALIFFKERLNIKQWIGIIMGTVALSFIGI